MCVCVCVCERERESVCVCERERERESVCVCVCERERERERECVCVCVRERERERERLCVHFCSVWNPLPFMEDLCCVLHIPILSSNLFFFMCSCYPTEMFNCCIAIFNGKFAIF